MGIGPETEVQVGGGPSEGRGVTAVVLEPDPLPASEEAASRPTTTSSDYDGVAHGQLGALGRSPTALNATVGTSNSSSTEEPDSTRTRPTAAPTNDLEHDPDLRITPETFSHDGPELDRASGPGHPAVAPPMPLPKRTPAFSSQDLTSPTARSALGPTSPGSIGANPPQRIPNASVGKEYLVSLAQHFGPSNTHHVTHDALPAGLHFDEQLALRGHPTEPGEHRLNFHLSDGAQPRTLLLTINPDPQSLWLDKESDRSDPYWKKDADSKFAASADTFVAVGSVRGRSHAHIGLFRDDDYALFVPPPLEPHGWHLVCVADGAGSAKSSRWGSKLACSAMITKLKEALIDNQSSEIVDFNKRALEASEADKKLHPSWVAPLYQALCSAASHAQTEVLAEATAKAASIKDYATTLLAAAFRKTDRGAWFVCTYWVGDGAIGMWKADWPAPKLFGAPDTGEFAGQTTFLTSENLGELKRVYARMRFSIVADFDFLVLMTDGVSDPKFETEQNLGSATHWGRFATDIEPLLAAVRAGDESSGAKILNWMDFWSPGNHDDRTMLLVVPRASEAGAPR
jgi:serine/threonine protein phosphatase PrpC